MRFMLVIVVYSSVYSVGFGGHVSSTFDIQKIVSTDDYRIAFFTSATLAHDMASSKIIEYLDQKHNLTIVASDPNTRDKSKRLFAAMLKSQWSGGDGFIDIYSSYFTSNYDLTWLVESEYNIQEVIFFLLGNMRESISNSHVHVLNDENLNILLRACLKGNYIYHKRSDALASDINGRYWSAVFRYYQWERYVYIASRNSDAEERNACDRLRRECEDLIFPFRKIIYELDAKLYQNTLKLMEYQDVLAK